MRETILQTWLALLGCGLVTTGRKQYKAYSHQNWVIANGDVVNENEETAQQPRGVSSPYDDGIC
eukprot:scaffold346_cov116-Cylindrotheca_fusiformis.AAC.3